MAWALLNLSAMKIGILKEIKKEENRVAMTPAGVDQMVRHGHTVYVQAGAGIGSGFADEAYFSAGAEILPSPAELFAHSDLVMHVKEVMPSEYGLLREGQVLFTYPANREPIVADQDHVVQHGQQRRGHDVPGGHGGNSFANFPDRVLLQPIVE